MIYNLTEEQKDAILGWQQHQQKVISILRDHDMDETKSSPPPTRSWNCLHQPHLQSPEVTNPKGEGEMIYEIPKRENIVSSIESKQTLPRKP
jgi:hypothetical protein